MSDWSLDIAGTKKTLKDWGLARMRARFTSLGVDELTALRDGANFDAAALCAFQAKVKLFHPDGRKIFEGVNNLIPGTAAGGSESQSYTFTGPWQWLAQNPYKQLWTGGIGGILTSIYVSHIILTGTGTQIITRVLQYAIDSGAPIQIGTIDIPVTPPIVEIVDRTCATVILDTLQYAPDAVGWFDYSTSPPTFHCKQRMKRNGAGVLQLNLPAVTLSIPPACAQRDVKVSLIQPITARHDLPVPAVELHFEITNEVDGVQKFGFYRDAWPLNATGRENRVLSSTINLQGFSATHVSGTLVAETIQAASVAYWKKIFPQLNDARIDPATLAIVAGSYTRIGTDGLPSLGLPQRLLPEGSGAADWMINPNGNPVDWNEERIEIKFTVDMYEDAAGAATRDAGKKVRGIKELLLTATFMTTNAPDGETDYQTLETFEAGDPIPIGLARYLYESLATLHYDCSLQLTEQECSGLVWIGNVINLAGSLPEFMGMNALVQEVILDIDDGATTIVSGPPRQLSINDVLELLKANRARRRWTNPATQETGDLSGPSNVQLGRATANTNSIPGHGTTNHFVVKEIGDGESYFRLVMEDLNALNPNGTPVFAKKNFKARVATVCVLNPQGISQEMKAGVLMTEPWPIGT